IVEPGFCVFEVAGRCLNNNFRFTVRDYVSAIAVPAALSWILADRSIFFLCFQCQRDVEACVVGAGPLTVDNGGNLRTESVSLHDSVRVLLKNLCESLADGSEAGQYDSQRTRSRVSRLVRSVISRL